MITATNRIASQIQLKTGIESGSAFWAYVRAEVRVYDRILATKFGVHALLISQEKYGRTVAQLIRKLHQISFLISQELLSS